MCTCPRLVHRRYAGVKQRIDIVPCGKCHECISKAQNEFAALAVLEAKRSKSMYFCALTYRNNTCPIMRTEISDAGEIISQSILSDRERLFVLPFMSKERFERGRKIEYLVEYRPSDNVVFEPSLEREQVRLFLKRSRQAYFRKYGYYPSFRYAGFGEYGDKYFRPHSHYLFYDFSPQEMAFFKLEWQRQFGFMDVVQVPVLNSDGSPARVKVSKYVSKYLHKPKFDFQPLLDGLCEAPRAVSSRQFGKGVLPDNLKSFYLCEDLCHLDFSVRANEILKRRKSLVIDGSKFPLPRKISDDYFRENSVTLKPRLSSRVFDFVGSDSSSLSRFVEEGRCPADSQSPGSLSSKVWRRFVIPSKTFKIERVSRRSSLSLQVSRFARDRYSEVFIDKLRSYSKKFDDKTCRKYLQQLCEIEAFALEDRAERAFQIYLNSLKKQKYG